MWLPSSNPANVRGRKEKKRSKLRAIDKGTTHDIPGRLKRLAREIERGEHGDVRDAIVIFRTPDTGNDMGRIRLKWVGTGTTAEAYWMLSAARKRFEP